MAEYGLCESMSQQHRFVHVIQKNFAKRTAVRWWTINELLNDDEV
jgi:hypothetical protein